MAISEVISSIEDQTVRQLGLRRIEMDELAIQRSGNVPTFTYSVDGRPVGRKALERIRELVIPPAWSEVRIAADPAAHVQAVGRDEAGRLQYIYHDGWEDVHAATKLHRLIPTRRLSRLTA
jgi:DNA topoisomerase I